MEDINNINNINNNNNNNNNNANEYSKSLNEKVQGLQQMATTGITDVVDNSVYIANNPSMGDH